VQQDRVGSKFFWLAFRESANAMAILRTDRVMVEVNDAYGRLLGRDREKIIGQHAEALVAPEQWNRVRRDWVVLLREGFVSGDRDLLRPDGRSVRVQYAAAHERITGKDLVLWVVLESRLRPMRCLRPGKCDGTQLTPRELEVVSRIAMGQRVHEIAGELVLSPSTIQTHVRRSMAKLDARSQAQLVAIAISTGQLDPEVINSGAPLAATR
jgi:PAS domain S-box-containing protein